jgi:hypothetical protein
MDDIEFLRLKQSGPYRYKKVKGEYYKLCTGCLHGEGGAWLPLHSFWIFKNGKRAGKPVSQCKACERVNRGRSGNGVVPVSRVHFAFVEIERRLGRTEACRRMGVSMNLWYRLQNGTYQNMYYSTAEKALVLLKELRENNVARHKDSIKYGAAARGAEEKIPKRNNDFYRSHGDSDTEDRRQRRAKAREKRGITDA